MVSTKISNVVVISTLAGLLGCGTSVTHYGFRYQNATEVPDSSSSTRLGDEAAAVLSESTTVAFFPPDSCLDRQAAPTGSALDRRVLRLRCGSIMTELERAALKAGFKVVSWQSLRGDQRPIDYARDQGVDVLFEVNELDFIEQEDAQAAQNLEFFHAVGPGDERPIAVSETVADRCRIALGDMMVNGGLAASFDVKMVSVANGRTLWNFRQTKSDVKEAGGNTAYYPAVVKKKRWPWVLVGVGVTVAAVGALATAGNAGCSDCSPGMGPSIGMLAGGLAMGGAGIYFARRDAGQAEHPAQVVCARRPVSDPFAPMAQPAVPKAPKVATSFSYSQSKSGRDESEERRLKLMRGIVGEFMATLLSARRGAEVARGTEPSTGDR